MTKRLVGLALGVALFASPVFAERPHIDYTTLTKTSTATTQQTDAVLWTPATGNKFHLQGCLISADLPVKFELEVSDVDVVPPIYLESNGTVLLGGGENPIYSSIRDAVLTYSTNRIPVSNQFNNVSVLCWGYESVE